MEAALPCKRRQEARKPRETVASESTNSRKKTKYACIVEAHESTRKLLESTLRRNLEDHLAEKGLNSISHYNLVHKFVRMPQAIQMPDAKAAVDKEWEKLEKMPAWQPDKVQSEKEAQREKIKAHFATLMVICHLKKTD